MYNNKFVVCIKVDNKILREIDDVVYLPFGTEYTIYLKNLNSRKALVNVEIDNRKVINGLLLNANSFCELERFVEGFSMKSGPKLKFIEKTQQISDYRGDKPEDGLVRIEVQFEKEKPVTITRNVIDKHYYDNYVPWVTYPVYPNYPSQLPYWYGVSNTTAQYTSYSGDIMDGCHVTSFGNNVSSGADVTKSASEFSSLMPQESMFLSQTVPNDAGITVEGSDSEQKFTYGTVGELEENSHVIILRLYGQTTTNTKVETPLTVDKKIVCAICGHKNPKVQKCCGNCGARII